MQQEEITKILSNLFTKHFNSSVTEIIPFPYTASGRKYFRIKGDQRTVIGAYGNDPKENIAFITFAKHFKNKGINVPEIFIQKDNLFYLQEDLGDKTLMKLNNNYQKAYKNVFPDELKELYQKTIQQLIKIQIIGGKDLDYSVAYPADSFNQQSILWDLNYFKYYFLNISGIKYDEQKIEKDFQTISHYLIQDKNQHFLFRDFQSRNVMIVNNEPFLIDFQGGRKGAITYDLASLLYQSKANIPQEIRDELQDYYFEEISKFDLSLSYDEFNDSFNGYLFIRLLQVLGAYGKRGLIEKMPYFIQSIPLALNNLSWWIKHKKLPIDISYLLKTLTLLTQSEKFKPYDKSIAKEKPLVVQIKSFSYKDGYPKEESKNGGGFVFDCRNILNPGRYEPYKTQTGRDKPVQDFLNQKTHFPEFIQEAFALVDKAVENYLERDFSSLSVNFGCTGGQHRSVYAADSMALHLLEKYNVKVKVNHVVQERKNWINERY